MATFNLSPLGSNVSLVDALAKRASVREYAATPVSREMVGTLLAAAVRAPTAMHQEPWSFVVVQDRSVLRQITDTAKPLFLDELHRSHRDRSGSAPSPFADPAFDIFHGAGTLIVICGPERSLFVAADCWLAAENLMLAAFALGLGCCVIGSAIAALNTPQLREILKIPAGVQAMAPIVVGQPAKQASPTPRKAPTVLAWV